MKQRYSRDPLGRGFKPQEKSKNQSVSQYSSLVTYSNSVWLALSKHQYQASSSIDTRSQKSAETKKVDFGEILTIRDDS